MTMRDASYRGDWLTDAVAAHESGDTETMRALAGRYPRPRPRPVTRDAAELHSRWVANDEAWLDGHDHLYPDDHMGLRLLRPASSRTLIDVWFRLDEASR